MNTQMEKIIKTLEKFGMEKTSAIVYLCLFENGARSVSAISRNTGLYRPAIYKSLAELEYRGLVYVSPKGKQKLYAAEDLDKLQMLVRNVADEFGTMLTGLKELQNTHSEKPAVKLLEGTVGITHVFNDVIDSLKKGETFYRYTSEKDLDLVNSYLPKGYRQRRDAKKLERLVISNPVSGKQKRSRLERFIKYIPPEYDLFQQNIIELIYGNKVALIDLDSKTSLIVENKPLAEFQKVLFKLLYKKL